MSNAKSANKLGLFRSLIVTTIHRIHQRPGGPALSGSWEEIWRSLESVEFFDLDKVVKYTLLLGNATTTAKVGFFLEQHRDSLMVENSHLEPLRDKRPRQPHYLESTSRKSGRLVADWNLIVPVELLERRWGGIL